MRPWIKNAEFGCCPICNGPLGQASSESKGYLQYLLYCSNSIYLSEGKRIAAPWEPGALGGVSMTDGHFYQRFEEETRLMRSLDSRSSVPIEELKTWDNRIYKMGNSGYEICYTSTYNADGYIGADSVDTIVNKWDERSHETGQFDHQQMIYPKVVYFPGSFKDIKDKIDSLLNLQ